MDFRKRYANRLCIKPGIQEQRTECRERGEWLRMLYSGEWNVATHSGEFRQKFRKISSNIPGNVRLNIIKYYRTVIWNSLRMSPKNIK